MKVVEYHPWKIMCDVEATIRAYQVIEQGDPERCGCDMCLNYIAQRKTVYPDEFVSVLNLLGIDFEKEGEVYHIYRLSNGRHHYGGWYHCVGELEYLDNTYKPDDKKKVGDKFWQINKEFSWRVTDEKISLPHTAFQDQGPLLQIDFRVEVPWVVSAVEPGD